MANTRTGSRAKKSNTGKKRTGRKPTARKTKAQIAQQQKVRREILQWVLIAVPIFLFLSNFGICGTIGDALRSVMLGVFGTMGFLFPVLLAGIVGLVVFNRVRGRLLAKIIGILLLFLNMTMLFHMFSYGNTGAPVTTFYEHGSAAEFGGGFVGAGIAELFCSLIGVAGTYILILIFFIICIVILTEHSIMDTIKDKGQYAYESAKEEAESRREEHELLKQQRRIEKREARRTRKVGVDFGETQIDAQTEGSQSGKDSRQEVHEIHIEGLDETPKADEHANDGTFQPKERIQVSDSAMAAMNRKPYGVHTDSSDGQTVPEPVQEVEKKLSSEGKIIAPEKKKLKYKKPSYALLKDNPGCKRGTTKVVLMATATKLKQVLANFGVNVEVTNVSRGPSVTRYELQPEMGTKVSRITGLADDIKLNMAAADIRIEAPIPGKAAVGIEIPNEGRDPVYLKELLNSPDLKRHPSKLAFPAGKDIAGRIVVADIAKMPHMLIAGTTGSGKSVFTNSILMSILYRSTPEEVRLIVIDPKVVEFQVYNKIPHLLYDVVTDPKKAAGILNWAVAEMGVRYKKFAGIGAKDIGSYNAKIDSGEYVSDEKLEKMPQILIIIDELADLMMVAAKEVEEAICRLAQLARAAGIHMVIATQRPSVDVITGLIKANIPSRVALTVASGTDSRTIIDMYGAEKLLGNGDMLFYPAGYVKPVRLQGAYVSEQEIADTVRYIIQNSGEAEYDTSIDAKLVSDQEAMSGNGSERDPIFAEAGRLCIEKQKGSTSMLQRQFKVGFNRAARVMEQLYDAGVVGQEEVNKPRKVIMSMEEFEQII